MGQYHGINRRMEYAVEHFMGRLMDSIKSVGYLIPELTPPRTPHEGHPVFTVGLTLLQHYMGLITECSKGCHVRHPL